MHRSTDIGGGGQIFIGKIVSGRVCVGGVAVSMVAFHAIVPGSTPGRRKPHLFL